MPNTGKVGELDNFVRCYEFFFDSCSNTVILSEVALMYTKLYFSITLTKKSNHILVNFYSFITAKGNINDIYYPLIMKQTELNVWTTS